MLTFKNRDEHPGARPHTEKYNTSVLVEGEKPQGKKETGGNTRLECCSQTGRRESGRDWGELHLGGRLQGTVSLGLN